MLLIALTGVYAYRFEVSDIAGRIAGELFPSEPQVGRGGEVIVNRRLNGEFMIVGAGQWRARDLSLRHRRFRRGADRE